MMLSSRRIQFHITYDKFDLLVNYWNFEAKKYFIDSNASSDDVGNF